MIVNIMNDRETIKMKDAKFSKNVNKYIDKIGRFDKFTTSIVNGRTVICVHVNNDREYYE